ALPHGAVRVEEDGAAGVVLVVEQELAEAAGVVVVRVPRVRIGAEVEDVARVPRTRPVGAYEPDRAVDLLLARGAVCVELDVRLGQGLAATDRVVAGGAVEPVEAGPRALAGERSGRVEREVVPAADDEVVLVVRVVQRVVRWLGCGGVQVSEWWLRM